MRLTSYESKCKRELICNIENCDIIEEYCPRMQGVLEKLAHYENLEEHGKLLILSCAVGDTVYEVQKLGKRIQPYEIISIKIGRMGEPYYYWKLKDDYGFYSNLKGFGDSRLGEDVFLTKDQAEIELKNINETK